MSCRRIVRSVTPEDPGPLSFPPTPFVTSDCPVHRYYVPVRPDLPYEGLLNKRVQVRFPLSRKKMLVIRHDSRRIERIEKRRKRLTARLRSGMSALDARMSNTSTHTP